MPTEIMKLLQEGRWVILLMGFLGLHFLWTLFTTWAKETIHGWMRKKNGADARRVVDRDTQNMLQNTHRTNELLEELIEISNSIRDAQIAQGGKLETLIELSRRTA